jgi:aspartyl-tRNA(Asn)/glutamyl-tRNA(Gln) amidotransferase subunit C
VSVDSEIVRRVAKLARIEVDQDRVPKLAAELNGIFSWIEQLQAVDVAGVEPMTAVTPMALKRRKDEVTAGDDASSTLMNAPESVEGFFVVPKVVA